MQRTAIMNWRDVGRAQIKFRGADQGDAKRAKSMAERGPLRHRGHLHHAQGNADAGAEHQRDGDPLVIDDAVVQQRSADRQDHADFAGPDAVAGGLGSAHPFQRKNEEHAGDR